jgi:hypothetical protein
MKDIIGILITTTIDQFAQEELIELNMDLVILDLGVKI